jgi:hypothetical protein
MMMMKTPMHNLVQAVLAPSHAAILEAQQRIKTRPLAVSAKVLPTPKKKKKSVVRLHDCVSFGESLPRRCKCEQITRAHAKELLRTNAADWFPYVRGGVICKSKTQLVLHLSEAQRLEKVDAEAAERLRISAEREQKQRDSVFAKKVGPILKSFRELVQRDALYRGVDAPILSDADVEVCLAQESQQTFEQLFPAKKSYNRQLALKLVSRFWLLKGNQADVSMERGAKLGSMLRGVGWVTPELHANMDEISITGDTPAKSSLRPVDY